MGFISILLVDILGLFIFLGLLLGLLFGIIGMVIATPVVAILKIIYVFLDEKFDFWGFMDKE